MKLKALEPLDSTTCSPEEFAAADRQHLCIVAAVVGIAIAVLAVVMYLTWARGPLSSSVGNWESCPLAGCKSGMTSRSAGGSGRCDSAVAASSLR
jgi:hypothetical protein